MNTERGKNPDSRVKQSSSQQRMKRNCSSINDFFEDFEKVKNIKLPDQLNLADSFVSSPKIAVEVSLIKNKKKSLN